MFRCTGKSCLCCTGSECLMRRLSLDVLSDTVIVLPLDGIAAEEDSEDKPSEEECKKYGTFWAQFGRAIKLGIIEVRGTFCLLGLWDLFALDR